MPRIAPVNPATATGRAKEIYDGPLKGLHKHIFTSMMASPAAVDFYLAAGGALKKGVFTEAEREAVALVSGQASGCEYCLAAHTLIGVRAGLTPEQTIEIRRGTVADPRLSALTRFTGALIEKKGHVSDQDVAAFRAAGFGDAHLAEISAVLAVQFFTNTFNHLNQTPVDFPAAPAI